MMLLFKKQKVEEEIQIEDEVHSVTPKKKAGSTVSAVEEAVEMTPKESLQSRAIKFLKPTLTPVPPSVASRPTVTTSSSSAIPTSATTSSSIPTSPPPPYVASAPAVVGVGMLPTVAATANASTGTIHLLPVTDRAVMR